MEQVSPYSPERKAFDSSYRLRRINNLRRVWEMPDLVIDIDELAEGPAVGIEIEVTWPQAFPAMREQWHGSAIRPRDLDPESDEYRTFSKQYDENDRRIMPLLRQAENVIPRVGRDAYWEFSFLPTKHAELLLAEVQTLYQKGILEEGQSYATHLTLSGINKDSDAAALLLMLEKMGGTNLDRLTKMTGWSRKGMGGVHRRNPNELLGNDTCAYELRTLVATSLERLSDIVVVAQQLGMMIRDDPVAWGEIKASIRDEVERAGLPWKGWPSPDEDVELWQQYSAAFITE